MAWPSNNTNDNKSNNNKNSSDSNRCGADCVLADVTLFAASPNDIYIIATVCHLSFWNVTAIKALSPALTSVPRPHPACFFSLFFINPVTKWLKSQFGSAVKGTKSQTSYGNKSGPFVPCDIWACGAPSARVSDAYAAHERVMRWPLKGQLQEGKYK